jgi:hypothetical protein
VIIYRAVPYLLLAAPPAIFLLTVLLGSCTMARTSEATADRVQFYSDPHSRVGEELASKLDRRAARADLRRIVEGPRQ